jgi:hypothetical protein
VRSRSAFTPRGVIMSRFLAPLGFLLGAAWVAYLFFLCS